MIVDRFTRPVRVDKPVRGAIDGHHRVIDGNVWAYWILGDVPWGLRSEAAQTATWHAATSEMAAAVGRDVDLLIDQAPFDAAAWAAALDNATPDPLPDVPGCDETWPVFVNRGQDAIAGDLEPLVAWGVCLGPVPRGYRLGDQLPADLLTVERALADEFASDGLRARFAHARELAWLVARSAAPGHPAPPLPAWDRWDEDECRSFGDTCTWESTPTGRVVKVTVGRGGELVTRYVAVLTMGRMDPVQFPRAGVPWIAAAQQLRDPKTGDPIPVRVAGKGRVLSGDEAAKTAIKWMRRSQSIRRDYAKFEEEIPPAVDRTVQHAVEVFDEVNHAEPDVAARWHGVIRFTVDAETEADADAYARMLESHFSKTQKMWLVQPGGKAEPFVSARMLREFDPGVRPDTGGYKREWPLRNLAGGVANMGTTVGTPGGFHLGWTVGECPRPVFNDPWFPMRNNNPTDENNNSGFFGAISNLGGGKSYLFGTEAEASARAGVPTYIWDGSPGAPLAALCRLPYLAPFSTHIALSGASAGLCNPYNLIPDPQRDPEWDDDRWRAELAAASGDRKELVADTILDLMPASTRRKDGMEEDVREAVSLAGGRYGTNPRDVLTHLAVKWPQVAAGLSEMADGIARLIFPPTGPLLIKSVPRGSVLTVITPGDLSAPDPTSDRDRWTGRQRSAHTAIGLAAFLVSRGIYSGRMTDPKMVILDEFRVINEWQSGQSLFNKLQYDHRKYRAAVRAGCQDPQHLANLGVGASLGGMYLGRQRDIGVATEAFKMAGLPPEQAGELRKLRTGQFVLADTYGRAATIQVKRAHDLLHQALTPTEAPAFEAAP